MGDTGPRTWIEITSIEHGHGGSGWELGTCLWSPATSRTGADRYALMRQVRAGDEVFHFVMAKWPDGSHERRVCGRSVARSDARRVTEQPPLPGDWANRGEYLRVDLDDYREFNRMVGVEWFAEHHREVLRGEVERGAETYPFTRYGTEVRLAAGLYLRLASPWLRDALLADAAEENSHPRGPTPAGGRERLALASYRTANEEVTLPAGGVLSYDPGIRERGVRGHARTQNLLAEFLRANGLAPRSPGSAAPDFDLAWDVGEVLAVAEVKSLTVENEVGQLRLGLGQLIHYRHQLKRNRGQVKMFLITERRPTDDVWIELCDELGVTLSWPPVFPRVCTST